MTITEFLLARITEDEAVARSMDNCNDPLNWTPAHDWPPAIGLAGPVDGPSGYESVVIDPARVLAECEAKRRIVERLVEQEAAASPNDEWEGGIYSGLHEAAVSLAAVYADHPDYDEAWRA